MAAGGSHPTSHVLSLCPCVSSGGSCLLSQLQEYPMLNLLPLSIPRKGFHDGAAGTRRACRLAAGAPKSGHAPSSALVS